MNYFLILCFLINNTSINLLANTSKHLSDAKELEEDDEPDPLEGPNRVIFFFNRVIDGLFFKPAAILYDQIAPNAVKKIIKNVKSNLGEVTNTAHYALQGDMKRSMKSMGRFAVNTTIGLGGTMDIAKEIDLDPEETNMNETLIKWGATPGFYVMLPVFGPSSLRGSISLATDTFGDPWYYITGNKKRRHNGHQQQRVPLYGVYLANRLDQRAQYIETTDTIFKTSLDPYATIRNYYFQNQKYLEEKVKSK